jgi:hypothetical protein
MDIAAEGTVPIGGGVKSTPQTLQGFEDRAGFGEANGGLCRRVFIVPFAQLLTIEAMQTCPSKRARWRRGGGPWLEQMSHLDGGAPRGKRESVNEGVSQDVNISPLVPKHNQHDVTW